MAPELTGAYAPYGSSREELPLVVLKISPVGGFPNKTNPEGGFPKGDFPYGSFPNPVGVFPLHIEQ